MIAELLPQLLVLYFFLTKTSFFLDSMLGQKRSHFALYLSDGMRDRHALTTAVLTTDRELAGTNNLIFDFARLGRFS